ncbi:MAG: transporter [Epsilonproteobacteria bacterium]|nr:transporter [Campylobacterota bacterium]
MRSFLKIKRALSFYTILSVIGSCALYSEGVDKKLADVLKRDSQPKEVLEHFQRDYILLKKGAIEFENNFQFSYNSANQIFLDSFAILDPVFLTLGQFGIESIKRQIISDIVTVRYGITDYLQAELAVPFIYRHDQRAKVEVNKEDLVDDAGLGDIAFSLSDQIYRETAKRPALIVNLSFKSKTGKSPYDIDLKNELPLGTGYYSIKAGVNFIKNIDPTVVFGGVAYAYNMDQDVGETVNGKFLEKVEPGDTISLNAGMGYAVTYNFSLTAQFQYDYTLSSYSTVDGNRTKVANSSLNVAQLKIGGGWALSKDRSVNVSLGIGLTSDSPDFVLEVRTPFKF